jgi:hypothetical protein
VKFVSTRDLRNHPGHVRELSRKEDLVLTANGKPFGLLLAVDEDELEDTARAVRQARAQLAISRMRKHAAERGLQRLTPDKINAVIGEVRAKRK